MVIAALACLAALAGYASYLDIRYRRLPNWLCLVCLVAGLAQSWWQGGTAGLGSAAIHMLIALAAGMILFRLAIFGGGDAKFYAAIAAWFPIGLALYLLVAVSVSGLLVLIGWMMTRKRLARHNDRLRTDPEFRKVPYGVAIAIGALLTFVSTGAPLT
jgi:prepilin peptidase CpaA